MEYLIGLVERITYINEENGFSVIKIKTKQFNDLVTAVGNMASVNVGAVVKLKGVWKSNSQYGNQFSVIEYQETIPATVKGIEKYLGSGLIKGIGPVNAKRIVNHFKENTLKVIEEAPDELIQVEGIGKKRVDMIKKAWKEQKEIKNIMLFLQSNEVSTAYAVKIYKTYKEDSIKIVKENPYRLADDIWGIGFKTADKIASSLGFVHNSYERCRAGLMYVLSELSNEGHCFATEEQLIQLAISILEIEEPILRESLKKCTEDQTIIQQETAYYLPPFYYSEQGVTNRIKEILSYPSNYGSIDADEAIKSFQEKSPIQYDDIQIQAITEAIQSKFMILTGGPGTGKTTTLLAILKIFQKLGARVLLAAPTGRAAKRMSETTGMEAKTIHRLLEFKPPNGYQKNIENPLEGEVLIIDEASMIDILMMNNILKAVPNHMILLLVGDVDQLPSVGPGNVLKDLIESNIVNVVKLERIFRQAQGSMIIMNAHRVNKGMHPSINNAKDTDFFFIEEEDAEKIPQKISDLCAQRLPKYYKVNPIQDIQILCPMQKGAVGTGNMNEILQKTLNPQEIHITYAGRKYCLGDKVMQIKNNYDKNIFNGDIGCIIQIDLEEKTVTVEFDQNPVQFERTELDELVLAYATTIHKSQGSEYSIVIAPITLQHFMMLQRNLLYTCITRAKKVIVLIGSKKALGIAVRNNKVIHRNTMLKEKLNNIM